ncbi:MAG: alanine racemase [Halioglobus sp.]
MARPNQAQLDLDALRHNLAHAKSLAPKSRVMAVVKANAYGHGAVTIANALEPHTDALAVACLEEALELRGAGITIPILLLQGIFEESELQIAASNNLWLMIENPWQMQVLEKAKLEKPLFCWLKIDTGMHRLGIEPAQAESFYRRLSDTQNTQGDVVLCTHFASADDLQSPQTDLQMACFNSSCEQLNGPRSTANSPAVLAWPNTHFDWIRPGYMLYGNSPFGLTPHANTEALQSVMTLRSAITSIREVPSGDHVGYAASWSANHPSRIATVTIGYGDGYPRMAKNGTPVLVNGQRAALAGRVSMDMITIDITHLKNVSVGDEVVLWGKDLPLAEVAQWADTIGYELTTRMPARTQRVVTVN